MKASPCELLEVKFNDGYLGVGIKLINELLQEHAAEMTFACTAEKDVGGEKETIDRTNVTGLCACEFHPQVMLACQLRRARLIRNIATKG